MSQAIDLSKLPRLDIIKDIGFEQRFEEIRQEYINCLSDEDREEFEPISRLRSDPLVKFFELVAIREGLMIGAVNDAVHAVLIAFAKGGDLDHIAATYLRTQRKVIQEGDEGAGIDEIKENDESLLQNAIEAPDAFATAGPARAWERHAKDADTEVKDAKFTSIEPLDATITILSREGSGQASEELRRTVLDYLDDDIRTPQGDVVTVKSAEIIDWQLEAVLTMGDGPDSSIVLNAAIEAVQTYADRQHGLGRPIRIGALYRALQQEGVDKVDLIRPLEDIEPSDVQSAYMSSISILEAPRV